MWVRKPDEEIGAILEARDRRRKVLWRPLAWASGLTAVSTIAYSFGLRGCSRGFVLVSQAGPRFGANTIVLTGILFVIFFGLSVSWQRRGVGPFADNAGIICRECKEPSHPNQQMVCGCGGGLEPLAFFDWISESDFAELDKNEIITGQ